MNFALPACEILDLLDAEGTCNSELNHSIRCALERGLLDEARVKAQQSIHFCADVSSDAAYARAIAHMYEAIIAHAAGDLEDAHQDYHQAHIFFRTTAHPNSCWHEAVACLGLSLVAKAQRRWSDAQRYCDQGLHTLTRPGVAHSRAGLLKATFGRRIHEIQDLIVQQVQPRSHIPIVGKTAAGTPCLAVPVDPEEAQWNAIFLEGGLYCIKKDLESCWTTRESTCYYAVAVEGDSMLNASIVSGDYVIFREQSVAENSEIVVVRIDYLEGSRSTVKHLHRRNGKIVLKADNPHYEPQELVFGQGDPGVSVLGKVVAIATHKS